MYFSIDEAIITGPPANDNRRIVNGTRVIWYIDKLTMPYTPQQ